jgi:hypothetical protein
MTHAAKESSLQDSIKQIAAFEDVPVVANVLRVED